MGNGWEGYIRYVWGLWKIKTRIFLTEMKKKESRTVGNGFPLSFQNEGCIIGARCLFTCQGDA